MSPREQSTPARVMVAVCTYRRNDPLRRLLEAIQRNAEHLGDRAIVGVAVTDDNPDGRARSVCDEFTDAFELGIHYRASGQGNISIARNLALEAALPLSDWVAMTDDDCEPDDGWLGAYLDAQDRTGTDALTGPCLLTPAPGSPRWLSAQPFLQDAQFDFDDGATLTVAATNNSFIRSAFLVERPTLRFDPDLGVVGGEDMVFFRSAVREGLTISFAADAVVRGHEPADRCTFRYQVASRFWLGNTEFVTNRTLGDAGRPWWFLRGCKAMALALTRPVRHLVTGRPPQVRYAVASGARALGVMAGAVGVRVAHH